MSETPHAAPAGAPERYDEELGVKGIVTFGVVIALVVAASFVGMWQLSKLLKAREVARDPEPSPVVEARQPRPRPRAALQAAPNADMAVQRAEEEKALTSYGWVDEGAGIARIPVARAIELVAERGLPEVPAAAAAPAAPASAPAPGPGK